MVTAVLTGTVLSLAGCAGGGWSSGTAVCEAAGGTYTRGTCSRWGPAQQAARGDVRYQRGRVSRGSGAVRVRHGRNLAPERGCGFHLGPLGSPGRGSRLPGIPLLGGALGLLPLQDARGGPSLVGVGVLDDPYAARPSWSSGRYSVMGRPSGATKSRQWQYFHFFISSQAQIQRRSLAAWVGVEVARAEGPPRPARCGARGPPPRPR